MAFNRKKDSVTVFKKGVIRECAEQQKRRRQIQNRLNLLKQRLFSCGILSFALFHLLID